MIIVEASEIGKVRERLGFVVLYFQSLARQAVDVNECLFKAGTPGQTKVVTISFSNPVYGKHVLQKINRPDICALLNAFGILCVQWKFQPDGLCQVNVI